MERASKKEVDKAWNYLGLFLFSCGFVELSSKIMLELEQNNHTNTLLYVGLFCIVALFLTCGIISLIEIYRLFDTTPRKCDTRNK